ncbi:phenylacetate--CoA ligase family protein [Chloroflexota bacterium]
MGQRISHWAEWETLSREELKKSQWHALKLKLDYLWNNSEYYRHRLQRAKVTLDKIRTEDDFRKRIPCMYKQDLISDQEKEPPWGARLSVRPKQVSQVYLTSGTAGTGQEVHCLTEVDLELSSSGSALGAYWAGIREGQSVCMMLPVGTTGASVGTFLGLRQLRSNVFSLGPYDTQTRIRLLKTFQIQYINGIGAVYFTHLTSMMQEQGIDPRKDLSVKAIVVMGPYPVEWAKRMEDVWGAKLHELYGITQAVSTVGHTCELGAVPEGKRGCIHLFEPWNYFEIIAPDTGEQVKPGEEGELVVTSISRTASPVLRFAIRDKVVYVPYDHCDCGRPLDGIEAGTIQRYDDMLKIRQTNVWPAAVDEVVFEHAEVVEYQGNVWVDEQGREHVLVKVEYQPDCSVDLRSQIQRELEVELRNRTGVRMDVEETPPGNLPRYDWKPKRWIDKRMKGLV